MNIQETINIIRESFETWYNRTYPSESPVSIVINYSDVQTLSIKAIHKITMEVSAVGIRDRLSYVSSVMRLEESYNHGITTEEEAKEGLTKKLMMSLYGYHR